jgi:alcohol dehydrogenase
MKAVITIKQGPPEVLRIKELPQPFPQENEVLIKVHAATVTQGDVMLRKLHPLLYLPMRLFGIKRKKIPGHEFAGEVLEVGGGVTKFKKGDRVFGTTTGISVGANAEFVCVPEEWKTGAMANKPENISFQEAAALPVGGMTALYILNKGSIQPGQTVLVYGASGSVGTYAVQIAINHFGASVTGVCSTVNVDLVKSLGAKEVVDYSREDLTQLDMQFDVVFDAVGKISEEEKKHLLKEDGIFLTVQTTTKENKDNLQVLADMAQKGKIKAVIDRTYPLEQVPEAHRYVESGRKKGNVVITVIPS